MKRQGEASAVDRNYNEHCNLLVVKSDMHLKSHLQHIGEFLVGGSNV